MHEAIKIVGGVAWIVGIILFFVSPLIGGLVLLVALALSVRSVSMTREKRHQELLNAARHKGV